MTAPAAGSRKAIRGRRFKTIVYHNGNFVDKEDIPYQQLQKTYKRLFMKNTRKKKRVTIYG